jgi:mannose-6-phosphate isomerase-like protein (cupin superfamily)|tara:strand:- start:670 stop:1101 length:432 start_codon:yes stop_codon:yes gene_type:complete
MTQLKGKIDKGWGYELIWASTEKYCGKILVFEKREAKFSMHFHKEKEESWFVNDGQFKVLWIDTTTAQLLQKDLVAGSTWHNPPLQPHQVVCIEPGSITEVSTADSVEDNYRVIPGDSQTIEKDTGTNPTISDTTSQTTAKVT